MKRISRLVTAANLRRTVRAWIIFFLALTFGLFAVLMLAEYGAPDVGILTEWLLDVVLEDGYVAMFAFTFLAAFGIPLPAGALLMASSFYTLQGRFSLSYIMLVGWAGFVAGDNAGFWLARLYGIKLLDFLGLSQIKSRPELAMFERRVQSHPALTAFLSRFVTSLAPPANLIMGFSKMRPWTFGVFAAIGQFVEVVINCYFGVYFGDEWESLYKVLGRTGLFVVMLSIIAVLAFRKSVRHIRRKREEKNQKKSTS